MVPHLMTARVLTKADKHIHFKNTHNHTDTNCMQQHTHICTHTHHKNTSILVMGLMETRKKMVNQQAEEKRQIFGFDLKDFKKKSVMELELVLGYKGRRGGFGRGIAGFRDPSGWVIGKLPDTALSSPEYFFFQDGQKDKSL